MQATIDNIGSDPNTAVIIVLTNTPSEGGKLVRRILDFTGRYSLGIFSSLVNVDRHHHRINRMFLHRLIKLVCSMRAN